MEKRGTIFDYLGRVFFVYGIMMTLMLCFAAWFGEDASEISSLFALGSKGMPVETMLQFLGTSFLINAYRSFFMTETVIKRMPVIVRTGLLFCMTVLTIVVFTLLFGWFPPDRWEPWAAFLVCFILCFSASIILITLKTRAENKKMAEGLNKIKERWQEKENEK